MKNLWKSSSLETTRVTFILPTPHLNAVFWSIKQSLPLTGAEIKAVKKSVRKFPLCVHDAKQQDDFRMNRLILFLSIITMALHSEFQLIIMKILHDYNKYVSMTLPNAGKTGV